MAYTYTNAVESVFSDNMGRKIYVARLCRMAWVAAVSFVAFGSKCTEYSKYDGLAK